MEAKCPMQYFNFILRQIFRMDVLTKFEDQSVEMMSMYGFDELFKDKDFDMQLLGPSVCKLVPGKAESDSWAVDISIFFPTAKVEDMSKVDKGIFFFRTPNDTEIVTGNASADSFDLIAEPQKTIGLLKLCPAIPELWEGQTWKSPNEEVYLKNIDLLAELDDDYGDISDKVSAKLSSVFAFKCSWPRLAEEWMTRLRSSDFPNAKTVETIIEAGCHVVSLRNGLQMADYLEELDALENPDIVWCYSFASAEKEICRFISSEQRQCYFLFRSTASSVPSNHLLPMVIFKSIFFYSCENIADSTWKSKPGDCYFILLKKLAEGLKNGFIPHYFIPEKNLLECISQNIIRENLKMLTFTRYQPLTSLYFLLDSMNLMSSEVCSFIEEMVQSACYADVRDEQSEQLMQACTSLLGSLITDQKYHNAMLVFNSLMDETALSEDKSVEMLNKQLWHIDMRRKWCFTLYMDIRQKSSFTKHLCYDTPTINITELFGDECIKELPNTIVPECYSIQNGDLYFLKWVSEVLEQCVGSKIQAKCMKYYLKKYSELAGDALVLPAIGVMDATPKMYTKHFKTYESNLEYYLLHTLANLYVTLFNIYYYGGNPEEFRELMPAYEMVANVTDNPSSKRNLYLMWKSLGETKKAGALSKEMSSMGLMLIFK